MGSQTQSTWWGLAFERLCQDHVQQILSALGVKAVHTEYYAWRGCDGDDGKNVQILRDGYRYRISWGQIGGQPIAVCRGLKFRNECLEGIAGMTTLVF